MKDQTDRLQQLCKKFLLSEIEDMTERELFEMILLFTDRKTEPSLRETLLSRYDSFVDMLSDSPEHLCQIGPRGMILAALAKLIRTVSPAFGSDAEELPDKMRYDERAARYCKANGEARINNICAKLASRYYDSAREVFRAAFLDESNRVMYEEDIAYGNIGDVYVDFPKLFDKAFKHGVKGILLAHNHPDGNLTPSSADIRVTERLKQACEIMGIKFVDHIIVYCGNYRSIGRKNGVCDTGEIMDMFHDQIGEDGFELGTGQIDRSGVYRQITYSGRDVDMEYRLDVDEYAEPMWDYRGEIDPEDNGDFFFGQE